MVKLTMALTLTACSSRSPATVPPNPPQPSSIATAIASPIPITPGTPLPAETPAPTGALGPLAPELIGEWQTSQWLDATGSQQIVRTYRFYPDARYEYTLALCRSSTDCAIQDSESGYAQTNGGVLSLAPQSSSTQGPRAYQYVVGRDPDVGDVQLHFTLADGTIDIFYLSN
jgi:hypothetical protein